MIDVRQIHEKDNTKMMENNQFNLPKFRTFQEAYHSLLYQIHNYGDEVHSRGTKQRELSAAGFTILDIENPIAVTREMSMRYAIAELIWYWSGSNSKDWISQFAKFWDHLTDDGETSESAYGYIIQKKWGFDQLEMVKDALIDDKESRRATIKINSPRTKETGSVKNLIETHDEWCTMDLQFLIRNDKLNMIVHMRSNDLWAGIPYDVIYFTSIQKHLLDMLKDAYPELETGTYTHFVGSIHEYGDRLDKFSELLAKHTIDEKPSKKILTEKLINDAPGLYKTIEDKYKELEDRKKFNNWFNSEIVPEYTVDLEESNNATR